MFPRFLEASFAPVTVDCSKLLETTAELFWNLLFESARVAEELFVESDPLPVLATVALPPPPAVELEEGDEETLVFPKEAALTELVAVPVFIEVAPLLPDEVTPPVWLPSGIELEDDGVDDEGDGDG